MSPRPVTQYVSARDAWCKREQQLLYRRHQRRYTQNADAVPVRNRFRWPTRHSASLRCVSKRRSNRWIKRAKRFWRLSRSLFTTRKRLTNRRSQFGLIAEEVAEVNPHLVVATGKGDLQRSLRSGERDVTQRVSQRARKVKNSERSRSSHCDCERAGVANPKGERTA